MVTFFRVSKNFTESMLVFYIGLYGWQIKNGTINRKTGFFKKQIIGGKKHDLSTVATEKVIFLFKTITLVL